MEHVTQVEAEPREEFGKNAARRLRATGKIPGRSLPGKRL